MESVLYVESDFQKMSGEAALAETGKSGNMAARR
jgi:hypothetical protein